MKTFDKLGIGRKFSIINQELRHMYDAAFAENGVTGTQAVILYYIYSESRDGIVYQRDIEAEFKIRRSSVTSVLQGLERNGFICRESVKEDSRLKKLVPTGQAAELSERLEKEITAINRKLLKDLDPNEITCLNSLLNRIMDGLP